MDFEIIGTKKIQTGKFELLTYKQFIEHYDANESFGWCDGYLMHFTFYDDAVFDAGIQEGIWKYRGITVAPMPVFEQEVQCRYSKKPVLNMTGSKIMAHIAQQAKEMK